MDSPARDVFGRTLEDAQQEDDSYRADYLARARSHVARLNRMESQTGITAAAVAGALLVAALITGMSLDPARFGWPVQRLITLFYGLIAGTVATSMLGVAGIGIWSWLRESIRGYNREIGIELDEADANADSVASSEPSTELFRDCRECGASVAAQTPTCRSCGAVPQAPKTPTVKASGRQSTTLAGSMKRTFVEGVRKPLEALGLMVLFMAIIAAILLRLL